MRLSDFPDVFGTDESLWRDPSFPLYKQRLSSGKIQEYIAVVTLPLYTGELNLLSPTLSLSAAGILPEEILSG